MAVKNLHAWLAVRSQVQVVLQQLGQQLTAGVLESVFQLGVLKTTRIGGVEPAPNGLELVTRLGKRVDPAGRRLGRHAHRDRLLGPP